MARILIVDNYDSFVWNIVSYLAQIGAEVEVWRNDDARFDAALEGHVPARGGEAGGGEAGGGEG